MTKPSTSPYEDVTARIVAALEAGAPPWTRPWSKTWGRSLPHNASTGRAYSGVNVLLLWQAQKDEWPTPRYLTFKQALELGGNVRKGEHGTAIIFTKTATAIEESDPGGDGDDEERHYRVLKRYTVFNVAQCDGLPNKITNPLPRRSRHRGKRDPLFEEFLEVTGAQFRESTDGRARYNHKLDTIFIPAFGAFDSAADYYDTASHELVHWTGHKSRLDRSFVERFGEPPYRRAAEELVAELGAAFICAEFGIDNHLANASYIDHWITLLKSDNRAIFTCASAAQKAVDYLRDLALREPTDSEKEAA
jgi:antirestriction protein ArdC